jgi:hypothetical protein
MEIKTEHWKGNFSSRWLVGSILWKKTDWFMCDLRADCELCELDRSAERAVGICGDPRMNSKCSVFYGHPNERGINLSHQPWRGGLTFVARNIV